MAQRLTQFAFCCLLAIAQLLIALPASTGATWAVSPAQVHPQDPPGTWTLTGSMTTPRAAHTMTLLPNGLVLVTGGEDTQSVQQATAELYNPATGLWTITANMANERSYHSATLLPNGRVLVAGGQDTNDVSTATAELYDPTTQTWTPTGSMHTPRHSHGAVLLPEGKVLVVGGWSPATDLAIGSAEIYDPDTGLWTSTGDLHVPRAGPTPILLPNGKVFLVGGGTCCPYSGYNSAEIFNPDTNTWTLTAPMSIERSESSVILLPSGKVLVAGGQQGVCCPWNGGTTTTAELYDPTTNTWAPTGSLNIARGSQISVLLANGDVLIVGGQDEFGGSVVPGEIYDAETGVWSLGPAEPVVRNSGHAVVSLPNGQVLVSGGGIYPANLAIASVELYTPATPAPPASGNLLTNPGFELDTDGDTHPDDWTTNPVVTRSDEQVHSGGYAMRSSVDLDSSYTIQQSVGDVQPGAPYAFSSWAEVPSINDASGFSVTMTALWRDGTGAITGTSELSPITQTTQSWLQREGVVTAPIGATTAEVQIVVHSLKGAFYLDDLYFGNTLPNGGFEQDDNQDDRADGWLPLDLARRTNVGAHGGGYALSLQGADDATYALTSAPVALEAQADLLQVSAAVKIPKVNDTFRFDIVVEWQDEAGSVTGTSLIKRYTKPTAGKWVLANAITDVPSGAKRAALQLVVTSLSGSIDVDDLAIEPYFLIPEIYIPLVEQ